MSDMERRANERYPVVLEGIAHQRLYHHVQEYEAVCSIYRNPAWQWKICIDQRQ